MRKGLMLFAAIGFIAATCLVNIPVADAQTQGMDRRDDRRDNRADARDAKAECKTGDDSRPECRQEKRETKREGRGGNGDDDGAGTEESQEVEHEGN